MPRKAFIADHQQAIDNFSHPNVSEVKPGIEDGSLTFKYALPELEGRITIQALVTGEPPFLYAR